MILYGIPTCDTCRKARKALEAAGRDVTFRDLRAEPLSGEELDRFITTFEGRLLNRSSTTWRGLSEEERLADTSILLAQHPTLIKRPIIDDGTMLHLGWGREVQKQLLWK